MDAKDRVLNRDISWDVVCRERYQVSMTNRPTNGQPTQEALQVISPPPLPTAALSFALSILGQK